MKKPVQVVLRTVLALGIASCGARAMAAGDDHADDIVAKADAIRFPARGFQVDVRVVTFAAGGEEEDVRGYRILSLGNERTLVLTMAPAVDRGQILLMRDKDLWIYLPKVTQPVRLPLSQKLTGQVANGDLARANFRGDYNSKLLREEPIDGRDYYVLELIAARSGVTYNKVHYWVDKENHRPYQAEFYTRSGKLLKTARYEGYADLGGAPRPTRLVLQDATGRRQRSEMSYSDMVFKELEDHQFTKEYLKRLQ